MSWSVPFRRFLALLGAAFVVAVVLVSTDPDSGSGGTPDARDRPPRPRPPHRPRGNAHVATTREPPPAPPREHATAPPPAPPREHATAPPLGAPSALYQRLLAERGLVRLISLFERLFTAPGSECVRHREAAPSPAARAADLCIRPEMLQPGPAAPRDAFEDFLRPAPVQWPASPEVQAHLGDQFWEGYPYLDGLAFKGMADCTHETNNYLFSHGTALRRKHCYLQDVRNRSLVYWYIDSYDLAKLKKKLFVEDSLRPDVYFFLLVHNLDYPQFPLWIIEHPQILKVFSCNVNSTFYHPKVVPLPLGIHYKRAGDLHYARGNASDFQPEGLLFAKFKIGRNCTKCRHGSHQDRLFRRTHMLAALEANGIPGVTRETAEARVNITEFHEGILRHRYVLSPSGHGLDTYRTWQSLYLGRPPIVEGSMRPEVLAGLPVVTVSDWGEVTAEFLDAQWRAFGTRKFHLEKLWFRWWVAFILRECLATP